MPGELALPRWPQTEVAGAAAAAAADTNAAPALTLEALVAAHAATLFRVAYAVLRNRSEAEDCVQDAFLRAAANAHQLPTLTEPRAWLVRIAWNAALDRRRRTRPEQADELFLQTLVSAELPADQRLTAHRELARTLAAVDRLPAAEREALLLSALDELTPTDIAAALGRTPSATRALLHRARTRLRERLAHTNRSRPKGAA